MSFLPLLLSTALMTPGVSSKAALLTSPDRHVRTLEPRVERLLATGLQRSATFASLMLRLEHSDVIVYIQQVHYLPRTIVGRLQLVPIDHQQRYLRIELGDEGTERAMIALLGHELRHAVEIAEHPAVRNQQALAALYERIGDHGGAERYDTAAARQAGARVSKELVA